MTSTLNRKKERDRIYSSRYYYTHKDSITIKHKFYRESHREEFRRRSHDRYWRKVWSKLGKSEEEIQKWLDQHYKIIQEKRNEYTRKNQ